MLIPEIPQAEPRKLLEQPAFTFHLCSRWYQDRADNTCASFPRDASKMTRIRTKPALPWHYLFLLLFSMCFFIFLFNQHGPLSSATYLSVTTEASLGGVVPSVFNKHVTKSLAELGPMDEINRHTVLFNRVPRSGSEMLVLLMQWLQGWNGFRHIRLKGDDRGSRLSRVKQVSVLKWSWKSSHNLWVKSNS